LPDAELFTTMLTVIPRINVVSGIRAVSLWAKALSRRPKRWWVDFGAICGSGSAEVSFIVNKWA